MPLSPEEQAKLDKSNAKLLKNDKEFLLARPDVEELCKELLAAVLAAKPSDIPAFAAAWLAKPR